MDKAAKRLRHNEYMRNYQKTPKGRAARKKYLQTPHGRAMRCASEKRRNKKLSYIIARTKWWQSTNGIASKKRSASQEKWKRWAIGLYKTNIGGCVDCGYNGHPAALDFDHLPEFKKHRNIAQLANCQWPTILEEITKCELVCANCHRIRTFRRHNGS